MAGQLPSSDTYWYKQGLFAFSFAPNDSTRLRISCTQANCTWENTRKDLKVGDTGVLHRHYRTKHSGIPTIDPARAANPPAAADPLDPVAAVEELEDFVKREHGLGPYADDNTRKMTKKERELAAKKQKELEAANDTARMWSKLPKRKPGDRDDGPAIKRERV